MSLTSKLRSGSPDLPAVGVRTAEGRNDVRVKGTGLSLLAALTLSACTATPTPTVASTPIPSRTTSSSPASSGVHTPPDGWTAFAAHTSCASGVSVPATPPRPVTAWAAVDRCRVIVTSPAGLTAITAEGDLIPLDPLSDLDLATGVAVAGDTIWVAGTMRNQHPALLMFTAGRRTTVSLPARVDAIDAIAAATQGINVAATVDGHGELLRVDPAGVDLIGELPGPAARLATSGGLFVLGTMRNGEASLLSGTAPPWRSRAIDRDVDIRAVATGDGLLVAAASELFQGAPIAAVFFVSHDTGRSWTRHRLPDAQVETMALVGADIYVTMTRPGTTNTLYRSTDAQTWTAVTGVPPSESLPELSVSQGTLWLIGDTVGRLPR